MNCISKNIREQMITHSINTFPNECCGFIFGAEHGNDREITDVTAVINAKEGDQTRRFQITAADYLKAEEYAVSKQLLLLGIYHSHPNHPSIPSEHDREVAMPFFSYLIISIINKEFNSLQSWQLNDNFQFEEELVITSEEIKNK